MEKVGAKARGLALPAIAAVLGLVAPAAAGANTITVSDPGDSGAGTLRAALAAAGPGDTILIPGSFTITLATQLNVNQAAPGVTIAATGGGMPTLNGNHATRILHVGASSGLAVDGLRFTGGRVNADNGAAIQMFGPATLSVNNSVFDDNGTTGGGGAGAIQLNSNVPTTISNSTFSDNFSDLNGGAINIFTPNTA